MQRFVVVFLVLFASLPLSFFGQKHKEVPPNTAYTAYFEAAYQAYPNIPRGLLEAVAWTNTRIRHVVPGDEAESCTGMPGFYGVMGYVGDGKGHFNNNLSMVALLSGHSATSIIESPRVNILAFAATFDYLSRSVSVDARHPEQARPILEVMSEIPEGPIEAENFALNSHLYSVFTFLNDQEMQRTFAFPDYAINLEQVFGVENLAVLSAGKISIEDGEVSAGNRHYSPIPTGLLSADYPPALWNPAASCNYSSRAGTAVSAVTIHTIQGSYAGAISWFQNCAASVSA
ncbi:MAG: hypothetical protein AAF570_21960, partial [Bacteroidota bacterium]